MKKFLKFGLGSVLVIFIVLVLLWIFFIDVFIESIIESKGTEVIGAKVELDSADLSLFPTGLTLTRLQVTNPDSPMTNAVDIARTAMSLDLRQLFLNKVIVEEMSVEEVRFGTERTASGAVPGLKATSQAESQFAIALPAVEIPDVKKILEKED